jgi:hypothetical protein
MSKKKAPLNAKEREELRPALEYFDQAERKLAGQLQAMGRRLPNGDGDDDPNACGLCTCSSHQGRKGQPCTRDFCKHSWFVHLT